MTRCEKHSGIAIATNSVWTEAVLEIVMRGSRLPILLIIFASIILVLSVTLFTAGLLATDPAIAQADGEPPGNALGATSDSDLWRRVRIGEEFSVSIPGMQAGVLVQSEGDNWRAFRNGPLSIWGAWSLAAILVILALFRVLRGRIRIDSGPAGTTITRFNSLERFAHWLIAISFIILGLTGLNLLYGRYVLPPIIGAELFADLTRLGKLLHNYVAFAFMVGIALIFVLWIRHNLPQRVDLKWIAQGGGLLIRGKHPPARKFNAGQKLVFWSVVLLGVSLSLSGIALLVPFEFAMFGKTFAALNIFGFGLPENLTPMQEMQLAQLWHSIVALMLIIVAVAHIYIGSIGMEGAFDAMGTGEVDANWAKEHHSLWVAELNAASNAEGSRK